MKTAIGVVLFVGVAALPLLGVVGGISLVFYIVGRLFFPALDYGIILATVMIVFSAMFWMSLKGYQGLVTSGLSVSFGVAMWALGKLLNTEISFPISMFIMAWILATLGVLVIFVQSQEEEDRILFHRYFYR